MVLVSSDFRVFYFLVFQLEVRVRCRIWGSVALSPLTLSPGLLLRFVPRNCPKASPFFVSFGKNVEAVFF